MTPAIEALRDHLLENLRDKTVFPEEVVDAVLPHIVYALSVAWDEGRTTGGLEWANPGEPEPLNPYDSDQGISDDGSTST